MSFNHDDDNFITLDKPRLLLRKVVVLHEPNDD